VKLTDFGIAVSVENEARTEVGVVKGKFGYMSPEQIKGAPLDRRSDVFAAGICLYELLTSERLFSGENDYKAVERVRNVDVPPPSGLNRQIPSSLERIVMKALAKQPRDRYQSTNDMRRALQAFLADVNEFVGQEDLAGYVRHTFAEDLAGLHDARPVRPAEPVTAAQALPQQEAVTGLSAFDDLEPVSSMRFLDSGEAAAARHGSGTLQLPTLTRSQPSRELRERGPSRPPPSVPPLIPRAESIPASAISRSPAATVPEHARRFEMDWDEEEPTTVSQGLQDPEHEPSALSAREADATRPLEIDDTGQGLVPAHSAVLPRANAWEDAPHVRSVPTLEIHRPGLLIGPGLVVGIFAAAAVVLAVYLLRGHGTATLRLETEPRDARVSIDGHTASGMSSPFVFSELPAGVYHDIRVEKSGYTTWSVRLRLSRDKTLDLPLVKLASLQPAPLAEPMLPAAVPETPPPSAAVPAPVAQAQPRNDAAHSKRPVVTAKRTPAAPSARPVAAAPAAKGARGTLRVNTRPWSQVSIDGKLIGNTPQMNLQLPAGTHTVVLSNPEFGVTKSLVVTIKPDETVTRVITLAP
jgi:hypothetical protein